MQEAIDVGLSYSTILFYFLLFCLHQSEFLERKKKECKAYDIIISLQLTISVSNISILYCYSVLIF